MVACAIWKGSPLGYVRYVLTIFVGSFLLFQVQPIVARAILPWFGGASNVWTTCMLFFQVTLFLGYCYTHVLASRLSSTWQARVHLTVCVLSLGALPVLPHARWANFDPGTEVGHILLLLAASVGIPYFVVSTNAPLIQRWFADEFGGDRTYRLYAVSNAASLIALVSYPFLVEPLVGVHMQGMIWAAGYVVFVLLIGWTAWAYRRSGVPHSAPTQNRGGARLSGKRVVHWTLLSACGVILLLAVTNQLCQDIAAIPFLWILPLVLYLVSIIICFDRAAWYDRRVWVSVFAVASAALIVMQNGDFPERIPIVHQIGVYSVLLFGGCMICHGELVRTRPSTAQLTRFYLWVSFGGALGGILVGVLAPLILPSYWELQFGIWACTALLIRSVGLSASALKGARWLQAGLAAVLAVQFIGLSRPMIEESSNVIARERNFYGVLRVFEYSKGTKIWWRSLWHGAIRHGGQFMHLDRVNEPTTYFGPHSGPAVAVGYVRDRVGQTRGLRLGVTGLGVGTIAAYTRDGDFMRYYEINPVVDRMSQEYFKFRRLAAGDVEVVLGDARRSLELEVEANAEPYDVLMQDAFSGDSVPVHLLTREAMDLYWRRLHPDGVLVIHISNLHLDFLPVVRAYAEAESLVWVVVGQEDSEEVRLVHERRDSARFVLMSRSGELETYAQQIGAIRELKSDKKPVMWTDDYSNLLSVLK